MKTKVLIGITINSTQKIPKKLKEDLGKLRGIFTLCYERDLQGESFKGDRIYRIAKARERIREHFLSKDFTHLLFIDTDISFPPETLEILLSYDADIVLHCYPSKLNKELIDTGMGCTLIKREVLEKCSFMEGVTLNKNFLKDKKHLGEDVAFIRQAIKAGFKVECLKKRLNILHLPYDFDSMLNQWIMNRRSN